MNHSILDIEGEDKESPVLPLGVSKEAESRSAGYSAGTGNMVVGGEKEEY